MREIWFKAIPFDKVELTRALEAGVQGVIAEEENLDLVKSLGRVAVRGPGDLTRIQLRGAEDEREAVERLAKGDFVLLSQPWEIIPVENILARSDDLALEVSGYDQALLAAGILERGVRRLVVLPEAVGEIKKIVETLRLKQDAMELVKATVLEVQNAGLGHRVCIDTLSRLQSGQGMLVGDSSAFSFLVLAETEKSPYVAPRPFRVNAGAVHAYVHMPGDRTAYLDELRGGMETLVVSSGGQTQLAVIGRVKVEVRPMLVVRAAVGETCGSVFLQNAETIRLCGGDGRAMSVTSLEAGDEVLVRLDQAGRHFGMRVEESIEEK